MPAVTSTLSMITPATAVIGGVLTLASLFRSNKSRKQAKAMQKQFRQLSSQIVNMHNDMCKSFELLNRNMYQGFELLNSNIFKGLDIIDSNMHKRFDAMDRVIGQEFAALSDQLNKGFEVLVNNQGNLFDLLFEGFQTIDFKLYDQDVVLYKMDKKLDQVMAELQRLGMKSDVKDRIKLHQLVERFETNNKPKTLAKILQFIQHQLLISSSSLKALTDQGNHLSGWYHLENLTELLNQQAFQGYAIDLKNSVNMNWAESVFESYIKMMPRIQQEGYEENSVIQQIHYQVLSELRRVAKPTADLIHTISSQAFLETFFNYYQRRLNDIKTHAERLLQPIQMRFGKAAMQSYAQNMLLQNQIEEGFAVNSVLQSIEENSHAMVSQIISQHISALAVKVREYNDCVKFFKQHTRILFDILQVDILYAEMITTKLATLIPIQENYYRSSGAAQVKADPTIVHQPTYHYIDMNTDSHFHSIHISVDEIKRIQHNSIIGAESMVDYLDYIHLFATLSISPKEAILSQRTCGISSQVIPTLPEKNSHLSDWYTSEDINKLLTHYIGDDPRIELLTSLLATEWAGKNELRETLIEFNHQRQDFIHNGQVVKNKVLIPINLNQNHWALLYIIYPQNASLQPEIYYFDPLGNPIPEEVRQLLHNKELYPGANITKVNEQVQYNGHDCGPWIIEAARAIINGAVPEVGSIDINIARATHERLLRGDASRDVLWTRSVVDEDKKKSSNEVVRNHFISKENGDISMKKMQKPENIERIIGLMGPIFEVAKTAKGKPIVYVMGITGDGKSTLLNYLQGTNYEKIYERSEKKPKYAAGSKPEVCKVGTSMGDSETLFPQLVEVENNNGALLYCDLPGLEETRSKAAKISGAYAPMILNEQTEAVKGIVWVVNNNQFNTTKAEKIKGMLSNLLKISRNNPKLIANAITIVITRGKKRLTKDDVINNFEDVIKTIHDTEQKQLMQDILHRISHDKNRIIISDVFDATGKNRNEIHNAVLQVTPQDKNEFDFSCYCKEQQKFSRKLEKVASHHRHITTQLQQLRTESSKTATNISAKSEALRVLDEQQAQDHALLRAHDSKLSELRTESLRHQAVIDTFNDSNELVPVTEINHTIPAKTQGKVRQVQTGTQQVPVGTRIVPTGTRPELIKVLTVSAPSDGYAWMKSKTARKNMAAFKKQMEQQGYTVTPETKKGNWKNLRYHAKKEIYKQTPVYESKPNYENRPIYRTETIQEPVAGNGTYAISSQADFPIEVEAIDTTGWTIKPGTERKDAGYEATAVYELGKGCKIHIAVKALKKYTEEGKQIIADNQTQKASVERNIERNQQERNRLQETITKNMETRARLQTQIATLQTQHESIEKEVQNIQSYLQENQNCFNAVDRIQNILAQRQMALINPARNHHGLYNAVRNAEDNPNVRVIQANKYENNVIMQRKC